jgi:cardiolipin synthase
MYPKIAPRRTRRSRRTDSGYISHNKIKLIRGGRPYFDQLLQMINEAKVIIQLQVYIFDDDETGQEVTRALIDAAKRNVAVYLMADGYASQKLSKKFIREVEETGVHFRFFEPLFRSRHSYFGRRLHHKVIVTDNRFGMVGGINISNHYNDRPDQPGWLDFAVFMEGAIVKELCRICQKTWRGYLPDARVNFCKENQYPLSISPEEDCQLRVRRNDWIMKRNQVSRSYIEMLRKAEHEIIMMSGYFLPGPVIRKNMKLATRRGVKIKLVLAGISDVMVAKNAERFMYNWLFRNKIEVYEYKPCVLHGKVAVYDRAWATVGSYNVNIISAYASIELNIDVRNPGFASGLQDELEQIINQDCERITKEDFSHRRGILHRAWDRICYEFIRFLFYIFTFNFKQRDN